MTLKILIVEGPQDTHVVGHICYAHGFDTRPQGPGVEPPFDLKPQGGFDALRKALGVAVKGSALTHIGVVIDADEVYESTGLSGRWCSIRDLLRETGYDCPEQPDPAGIIVEQEERPRVGVWVMPDNLSPGKLETFVATLVPPGNQLWAWAQATVDTIPPCEERFAEKDREKALVHTYLAVQKQPGSSLGSAIRQRYFDAQNGLAPQFMAWVGTLFEL